MGTAVGAAGASPTVFQSPAGLASPTPFPFLSPISARSQLGLAPGQGQPRPLETPYHHLALREVINAWQVRLDRQGHLKLAHDTDADAARGGGIGAEQNHSPVSCFLQRPPTGCSLLKQSRVYKGEDKELPSPGWVPLLKPSSPPLQQSDRVPSGATLPPAGAQDLGEDSSSSPQGRDHLGWVGPSPSPTRDPGMR